jgi:hypothetical protein
MSLSTKPRVVTAGTPMRIPLVTKGICPKQTAYLHIGHQKMPATFMTGTCFSAHYNTGIYQWVTNTLFVSTVLPCVTVSR